ncbi:uncharacterized protein LOC120144710 [Hibiscus syriacus]|uniref:uncharacterized protein LOC120144710 n=1 Tax=Hibiscus syriacus TaxID=106335 RepID=UPI001922863D|nr:uncharacterized protein LOC120144710 [Hibiscus syriacus]
MKTSSDVARGSRFAILGVKNNGVTEDTAKVPDIATIESIHEKIPANISRIDTRAKGKGTKDNGLMEVGASSLGYPGLNGKVTISEDSRPTVINKSIRNKGNKREVGDGSKGLKVKKKNKDFKFPPAVLTDWLRNATLSTHLDRRSLYGEGSSSLGENDRGEGNSPVVGPLETVATDVIFPDGENANPNLPQPGIVALLETQISGNAAKKVIRKFGFQNSFRVEALGFSGGIWLLWKDGLNVEVLTNSTQFIHSRCWSDVVNRWLYFTVVYASPQVEKRKLVWKHLMNLDPCDNEAWALGGDFNSILRLEEREGGASRGLGVSNLFAEFVFEMGLFEVDYRGPKFTWRRGNLCKRLDRCLMNSCWVDVFSGTLVLHLDRVGSDHCPLLLKSQSNTKVQGTRPFRFIVAWQDHTQFKNFLSEAWNNDLDVLTNVNLFQSKVTDWNLKYMLKNELEEVLQQEESLWLQKSRNQWILHGDKNTKFFHACTMLRRRHNYVRALKEADGSWISDQVALCSMAVNFYRDLFTSSSADGEGSITDNIIVAQEVVHSMRLKKGKTGYMAIKIDLEKAYDRLEWPFINDTLKKLHIPDNLRMLIMHCVCFGTVLCLHRSTHQEGFSKVILYHLICLLCAWREASIEQCNVIRGILELFCNFSGQKINIQKTTIYYSMNVDSSLKNSISASFGFQEVQNLGKYLGVPLLHSRITKSSYSYIVSRVRDKLSGWTAKTLSLAGRIS